ncbi:MAG: hypothetical protein JWQ42_1557 [Edaphobacter sp.]|nr:hypothetical protein [Edaphobacter sp.]
MPISKSSILIAASDRHAHFPVQELSKFDDGGHTPQGSAHWDGGPRLEPQPSVVSWSCQFAGRDVAFPILLYQVPILYRCQIEALSSRIILC